MPTGDVQTETRGARSSPRAGKDALSKGKDALLKGKNALLKGKLSERDLTVLRLGALGIFNVSFDAFGHVILP